MLLQLPFPIIVPLLLLLLASYGSAGNSKDKGKRKLGDTSFESQQFSSASQHSQHSRSPQPSHRENEDSISSNETNSDSDEDFETSISLDQVPHRLPMELEEMPAAFTAQGGFFSQSKNPEQTKREYLKYHKQNKAIYSFNEELGVAAQSKIMKSQTLEAYGQYILWLEKILLKNQQRIRNSLTVAGNENTQQPKSLQKQIQTQIQLFDVYIKNAEENAEYEQYYKKIFRVDEEIISKRMDTEFEQKIKGISSQAKIKRLKLRNYGRKDYLTIEYGKWILLLILPKLELKKPQDIKMAFAIEWAQKYTKSLREEFLKNYMNEMAHPPDFFVNLNSTATDQPVLVAIRDMEPDEELEKKEWDSFKKEVMREMSTQRVAIWLILDAYRRDILWLESLLLSHRKEIIWSLLLSGKENLISTFYLLFQNAETNRAYENMPADCHIFKLTPEEIRNDPETKTIHDALEIVGKKHTKAESKKLYNVQNTLARQALFAILPKMFMKKMPNIHIKTYAFEWARQYRKILREDFLAPFKNVWKPPQDFLTHIRENRNEKSGGKASASSPAAVNKNQQKMKQKMQEQ